MGSSARRLLGMTGPEGQTYVLGHPMHIAEGSLHLGVLGPVPVDRGGTEVHIGNFTPSAALKGERRRMAPLILLEITAFLVADFESVQVITFCLQPQIEVSGDGTQVARARAALLEDIGALDIRIITQAGKLSVVGFWEYNESARTRLAARLDVERANYLDFRSQRAATTLRARLKRIVLRSRAGGRSR